jgi:AAA family ATP:ADP antiporter
MTFVRWRFPPGVVAAMLASAAVGAQFVASSSARDALFLARFDATALPVMMIGSSVVSLALVAFAASALRRVSPAVHVPLTFGLSAVLILAEWGLTRLDPGAAARVFYLHVTGLGPMLGSGLWLVMNERFDPRGAKKHFGPIGAVQTLGGCLGGVFAASFAAKQGIAGMMLLPALLQAICAFQVRALARPVAPVGVRRPRDREPDVVPSARRVLAQTPYLRSLAVAFLFGTMAAAFVDYALKAQVSASATHSDVLAKFFSLYYASISLITFVVQAFGSRVTIEKLGLGAATAAPSLLLSAGSVFAMLVPGVWSIAAAHGGERVTRGSLYRTGYEQLYTPLAPADRRAVKALMDVGVGRAGDILGWMSVQMLLGIVAGSPDVVLLSFAIGCSMVALVASRSLTRGYVKTLEQSLQHRAVELDLSDARDLTTRTVVLRALRREVVTHAPPAPPDASVREIAILRSRNPEAIRRVLTDPQGLRASLIPHIVALLAWDPVAYDALRALRAVAEEHVGQLVDALIDPNQPFAVRRRLARVFSVCVSQRAADGLLLALDDLRFEVRLYCGRSLAAIVEKNPRVRVDREAILEAVLREVAVSRSVWEGRQLLDAAAGAEEEQSLQEQAVTDRANHSLAHVFTLLSIVFPTESLRLAFNALHSPDQRLRGTALEYLDAVLPRPVRDRLWPFLEVQPASSPARRREDILADLLKANESGSIRLPAQDPPASAPTRSKPRRSS